MKIAAYTGLLAIGFGMITGDDFDVNSSHAYYVGKNHGKVRLVDDERILDLVIFLNQESEIKGIFEDDWYEPIKQQDM